MSSCCGNQGSGRTILTFGPPVEGAVKIMMIICALTTLLLNASPQLIPSLTLSTGFFRPWQVVTTTFCHIGLMHAAFICFGLWIFGSQLENFWGTRKFLLFFIGTSTAANLLWLVWAWFFPLSRVFDNSWRFRRNFRTTLCLCFFLARQYYAGFLAFSCKSEGFCFHPGLS